MNNIFRGELISREELDNRIVELGEILKNDLILELDTHVVIDAIDKLVAGMNPLVLEGLLVSSGMTNWKAKDFIQTTMEGLSRESLTKKVHRELGEKPFIWREVEEGIEEKNQPFGVLMHIGAGNEIGLSVLSIIEGLLSGNINILKLPSYEGGISVLLLKQLVEIEPRLKPYIYVFDIASYEKELLKKIASLVDAIVVWGSDEAIAGVRQLAHPSTSLIEWGHRISFAYFTQNESLKDDLKGLSLDICLSEQQYCSSPQCVFYETANNDELEGFAYKLAKEIEETSKKYPTKQKPINTEAEITWTHELIKMEEILGQKRLISNEEANYSVMVDYKPRLKASPLYRNIWVMPIKRENLINILRGHSGHLQTVGLSCEKEDALEITRILYGAGVNRINPCGKMSKTYIGEPHDGFWTLRKYVRRVSRRTK